MTGATSSTNSDSSGLSSGTKIGLGVGIGLGVLVLVAAAVIIWLLVRRRKKDASHSEKLSPTDQSAPQYETYPHYATNATSGASYEPYRVPALSEVPDTAPTAEMNGEPRKFEADSQAFSPQELPAEGLKYRK